jgi:hypothetical protein
MQWRLVAIAETVIHKNRIFSSADKGAQYSWPADSIICCSYSYRPPSKTDTLITQNWLENWSLRKIIMWCRTFLQQWQAISWAIIFWTIILSGCCQQSAASSTTVTQFTSSRFVYLFNILLNRIFQLLINSTTWFGNSVLSRIFGLKREEVREKWKNT